MDVAQQQQLVRVEQLNTIRRGAEDVFPRLRCGTPNVDLVLNKSVNQSAGQFALSDVESCHFFGERSPKLLSSIAAPYITSIVRDFAVF